ncbi:hypothetical protein HHI36_000990 [Cryptolaemus montrouzieri]|uniref:Transposase n=1 Tax=Cryptolaemus montrouzieri TaxID=559131 RepID=A0ABD2P6C8_9CUCU
MLLLSEWGRIPNLIMGWGENVRSLEDTQVFFNETFAHRGEGISKNTVKRTINRSHATDIVKEFPRSGRPPTATNEDSQLNIALPLVETQLDFSLTVIPLLKKNSL